MSCFFFNHIISYHIISYHIISYHIISYHIISYHIISYHIIVLFYQGGMKAVIWSDVFQTAIMLTGMLACIIQV